MKVLKPKNSALYVPGVHIPDSFEIISKSIKTLQARRSDGLMVWFELHNDDELTRITNYLRATANKETVIMAVGLVVGLRASLDYMQEHAPELAPQVSQSIEMQLQRLLK